MRRRVTGLNCSRKRSSFCPTTIYQRQGHGNMIDRGGRGAGGSFDQDNWQKKCKNRTILVLSSDIRWRALMNRLVENWKQTSKLLHRQCLHIMKSCHFCLNCVAISSQSTIYMPMSAFCIFIWKVSQYQQIWREDCKCRKRGKIERVKRERLRTETKS